VLCLGLLALMLTSAVWSAIPVLANEASGLPAAGPSGQFAGSPGGPDESSTVDTALIRYLEAHQGKATFLVATASSHMADEIILETNEPVMALGGFSGGDPILTTAQLAALVKNGTVRFFLLNAGGGFGGGQSALTTWVTQNCTTVPASQWQSASTATINRGPTGRTFGPFGANQLYDCATRK